MGMGPFALFASILFSDPCRSSRFDPMIKAVQVRPFSLLPTEPSAGPAPTPCRLPSSAFSSPTSTASLRSLATLSVFERESSVSNKNVDLIVFVTETLFKFQQPFIAPRRCSSSPCRSRFIPTHVNDSCNRIVISAFSGSFFRATILPLALLGSLFARRSFDREKRYDNKNVVA